MPEESRLDRIERLNEQTAQQSAENAKAIAQLIADNHTGWAQTRASFALVAADIAATNVEMRTGYVSGNARFADLAVTMNGLAVAMKAMTAAKQEMLEAQTAMLKTLDSLAQLWGRSPN